MIVQCDSCQTRFRLPDSAVGAKGAKARCSRCGNVFIVEKPPEIETNHATLPPPAGYSGLTTASAALPQVASAGVAKMGAEFITESLPTTRTELPSFGSQRASPPDLPRPPAPLGPPAPERSPPPAARGIPAASTALGAFAPSSGGRSAFASLPPPPTAPDTSSPELSAEAFFEIPPPLSVPPEAPESPRFDGPAFGRTAEVSQFSRASYVSFPPLDLASMPPAKPAPSASSLRRDEVTAVPSFVGPSELVPWNVQDKETVRMEPSDLPELDRLPDAPPPPAAASPNLRATAEHDPFELQSALELGRASSSPPSQVSVPRARPQTAGPTKRLDVGRIAAIESAPIEAEPAPLPARELPAWATEALALLIAALLTAPFLLARDDPKSPLHPVVAFLSRTRGPVDPAALDAVRAEAVKVEARLGAEAGVVVHGRVRNLGATSVEAAEVLVHALEGDRRIETMKQVLPEPMAPDKAIEFAVVFPGAASVYRPLRFHVEVTPTRRPADALGLPKNP